MTSTNKPDEFSRLDHLAIPSPETKAGDYRSVTEQWLKAGIPLEAYQSASQGLARYPQDVSLLRLQALSLARCGATETALKILQNLVAGGAKDSETSGILARTRKDLWLKLHGTEAGLKHLRDSQALYEWGYQNARAANDTPGAIYNGINSAAMLFFLGDVEQAQKRAGEVRGLCGQVTAPDYWTLASEAEAELIGGDFQSAARMYRNAAEMHSAPADISTTRKQARLLLAAMGREVSALDSALPLTAVVTIHNGIAAEAFADPESLQESVAEAAGRLPKSLVYIMVARPYEIALSQAFLEAGHTVHLVLATRAMSHWNNNAGPDLGNLLPRCAEVVVAGVHRSTITPVSLHHAELMRDGLALLRAQSLDTAWSMQSLEVRGDSVQLVPAQPMSASVGGLKVAVEDRDGAHEYLRATLSARIINIGSLLDEQLPVFAQQFLGAIAGLQSRSKFRPISSAALGGELFFSFRSVRDAGRFALQLRELMSTTDWSTLGLPADPDLQMALNAGPILEIRDPVTQARRFVGTQLSETAQLQQLTPSGLISATQSFAAHAAAMQVNEFCCVPAGMVLSPVNGKKLPVYQLTEAG